MSAVFCVFREGVYRHECGGVFADLVSAIDAADHFADVDNDSHHDYRVVPFALGAIVAHQPAVTVFSPDILEAQPVYIVSKDTGKRDRTTRRKRALRGHA